MVSEQPVRVGYSSRVRTETVILGTLNRYLLNLEPSPQGSFRSKVTDPWGEGATEEDKTLG